ncbi:MAG: transcriptional regulator [Flavobacterium sp. MedPE-SWcel]|uniref:Fur family transcriptional regulator n=1 Tax=uncultured Flavobacterium sp. TaxID=165435 RepID=UPI000910C215|nr:transcriptional repressor [uncultured Flavobacterium sp.]OIQ17245.1 MAG: transcriptional regulator [Flavobacterium sp. MedPE-SWcel]
MNRRSTPAKKAVIEALKSSGHALSQEMIEARVTEKMDRVTIYRVLNSFCEDGITHKILSDEGKYYFALCVNCEEKQHNHSHFHFRCLTCQKVECLEEQVTVNLPDGYVKENITGWITGQCNDCS